ncbi:hypothetical protein HanPI659440_Chr09g0330011 [Helianthus annuus]|nr:hypothetical protein HanPI659440_Chr09g0330011 [Helianthus annuus]
MSYASPLHLSLSVCWVSSISFSAASTLKERDLLLLFVTLEFDIFFKLLPKKVEFGTAVLPVLPFKLNCNNNHKFNIPKQIYFVRKEPRICKGELLDFITPKYGILTAATLNYHFARHPNLTLSNTLSVKSGVADVKVIIGDDSGQ